MGSTRRVLIALASVCLIAALVVGGTASAGTAARAASPEAKEACKNLKKKIKKKKGKAKARAKAKYKKCLEEYDLANPPDEGTGGGTTDPGGGTTDPGGGTTDPGTGGGTGAGPGQCTSLASCPQLTRNDAAGQSAMGSETILERYSFGSSGQTAEYYRLFFYGGGAFKGVAVDWNSVSGETCRTRTDGSWSFNAGYTYSANGGGVVVEVNLSAGGQSGTEILDFRNGAAPSVYVGPQALHFEENPQANDQC
jgi:hypothetical protein